MMKKILLLALLSLGLSLMLMAQTVTNTTHAGSGPYTTIQAAINNAATVNGDNITISGHTFIGAVTVNKQLTISGAGPTTVITPPAGSIGITVTASGVSISNLKVTGSTVHGIYAGTVNNLTLSGVEASGNGTGLGPQKSGIALQNVKGTSVLNTVIASNNKGHGLEIGDGCLAVTVNGGTFNNNGISGDRKTGSGIIVNSNVTKATNGTMINGPLTANNNYTAGINIYCEGTINNTTVYGTESNPVTLNDNGSSGSGGAAVLIYGPCDNTQVTAHSTRSVVWATTGLAVLGTDKTGANSPTNTKILNSYLVGFDGSVPAPAATMYAVSGADTLICKNDVDAGTGNDIYSVLTGYAVEDLLIHKVDNLNLGLFKGPGTKVFVTPNSGSINRGIAVASTGYTVEVKDGTYTENVVVNKPVTVNGQGANTIIKPGSGTAVDVTVSGVTLQNLHIYLNSPFTPTVAPTSTNNTFTFPVQVKVFLQGPFSSGTMGYSLKTFGLIPSAQPYNVAPFNYVGTENVVAPANTVDWVLVQLRASSGGPAVATRAAFLKNDGSMLDTNGTAGVAFTLTLASGYDLSRYIVIKHRNHLAVMSAATVTLPNASVYDFTTGTSKYFGAAAVALTGGVYGLYAGDINNDASIDALDFTTYKSSQGNEGYEKADFTFDASVDALDFTLYKQNQGQECGMVW